MISAPGSGLARASKVWRTDHAVKFQISTFQRPPQLSGSNLDLKLKLRYFQPLPKSLAVCSVFRSAHRAKIHQAEGGTGTGPASPGSVPQSPVKP